MKPVARQKSVLCACVSSGVLALMMAAAPAHAQDPAGVFDEHAQDEDSDDVIVVTGTNIRGVEAVGSETISLGREQILQSGRANAADVVRTLPQVRDLGEFREGGTQGGNNNQQGNAINLRGLGQAATLILVDGRRIVNTGASQTFFEANAIPMAALERIEVVADGASAVYGSDAVAGVVNFVIRKDYEGAEVTMRATNNSGGWEYTPGITAGTSWEAGGLGQGNILVSYEYSHREAYRRYQNPYLRQDRSPFGGFDARLNGTDATAGYNGNIVVPTVDPDGPFGPAQPPQNQQIPAAGANIYYGIPSGTNENLSAGDLLFNNPSLLDSALFNDYTGEMERHQVAIFLNQSIGDRIEFFAQGSYNNRSTVSQTSQGVIANVQLKPVLYDPQTNTPTGTPNPYYIDGLTNGPLSVQYNMLQSVGTNNWTGENESYNITAGLKAELPFGWDGEVYYTYGRDEACNYCQLGTNINLAALQYQIDIGAINPLNNVDRLGGEVISRFTGDNIQRSGNGLDDFVIKINGPLFALPAGDVRAAVGGEHNQVYNYNINGANRPYTNEFVLDTDETSSRGKRTIKSAFAELYIPIIGDAMNVPLVQSLTVSAAVRYDHYSDVGSTTNPKFSATWKISDALSLRGSWGTSFRAPNLPDVNPTAISSGGAFPFFYTGADPRFPQGPISVGYVTGANPDIKPESATNWQIGFDFEPLDRLRLSATYYNIAYEDRIAGPDVFGAFFNPTTYPDYLGYAQFIFPINNPATCVNGDLSTYDPVLGGYLGRTLLYVNGLNDPCSIDVLLDGRNTNLAATRQDGIDAQIDYFHPTPWGGLSFNLAANAVLSNEQQVVEGEPFIDRTGFYSSPIKWRGRGSVGVNYGRFNATLFGNYTGAYTNDQAVNAQNQAIAPVEIDPYVTLDLSLGYRGDGFGSGSGFVKSYRAGINIQNLTDRDPPLVFTTGGVFNPTYSNPFGRTFTFTLSAGF
ncbi:TonB-dependent receptor plug domain-containing protein [Aurantiacibacter xanthus]|nr:TonB-dependent receptor [Aurantiacibacter xanthus]